MAIRPCGPIVIKGAVNLVGLAERQVVKSHVSVDQNTIRSVHGEALVFLDNIYKRADEATVVNDPWQALANPGAVFRPGNASPQRRRHVGFGN